MTRSLPLVEVRPYTEEEEGKGDPNELMFSHKRRILQDGGGAEGHVPRKFGKIFSGNYHVKVGHFVNFYSSLAAFLT